MSEDAECPFCGAYLREAHAAQDEVRRLREVVAQLTARLASAEAREWQRYPLGRV